LTQLPKRMPPPPPAVASSLTFVEPVSRPSNSIGDPSTSSLSTTTTSISDETRRRIEENRRLAFLKLQEKQQQCPLIVTRPNLEIDSHQNTTGTAVMSEKQLSSGKKCMVWYDTASLAIDQLKRNGLFTCQSLSFCTSPLLTFYEVDVLVSFRLGVRFIDVNEMITGVETMLNRILQRYAELAVIVLVEDRAQLYKDTRITDGLNRLRSWSPSVRLFVAAGCSEASSLIAGMALRERHEGRECSYQVCQIVSNPTKRALLDFVTQSRGCNLFIAAAILCHFQSKSVSEMIDSLSTDLLCRVITPGLSPAQATKVASFYKRIWKPEI